MCDCAQSTSDHFGASCAVATVDVASDMIATALKAQLAVARIFFSPRLASIALIMGKWRATIQPENIADEVHSDGALCRRDDGGAHRAWRPYVFVQAPSLWKVLPGSLSFGPVSVIVLFGFHANVVSREPRGFMAVKVNGSLLVVVADALA